MVSGEIKLGSVRGGDRKHRKIVWGPEFQAKFVG